MLTDNFTVQKAYTVSAGSKIWDAFLDILSGGAKI
jgi:hypothetical protein